MPYTHAESQAHKTILPPQKRVHRHTDTQKRMIMAMLKKKKATRERKIEPYILQILAKIQKLM